MEKRQSRKSHQRLTRLSPPPPATGSDCRQLGLKTLYVGVDGCDFALGLRPHDRQIAFGSRGRLFGSYKVDSGAKHLAQELVCAIALALEIRPVTSGGGFDFRQLGFQQIDLGLQRLRDREVLPVTARAEACARSR